MPYNRKFFYGGGAEGYTTYPTYAETHDKSKLVPQAKREAEKAFAAYVDGLRRKARISYDASAPKGDDGR